MALWGELCYYNMYHLPKLTFVCVWMQFVRHADLSGFFEVATDIALKEYDYDILADSTAASQ